MHKNIYEEYTILFILFLDCSTIILKKQSTYIKVCPVFYHFLPCDAFASGFTVLICDKRKNTA